MSTKEPTIARESSVNPLNSTSTATRRLGGSTDYERLVNRAEALFKRNEENVRNGETDRYRNIITAVNNMLDNPSDGRYFRSMMRTPQTERDRQWRRLQKYVRI